MSDTEKVDMPPAEGEEKKRSRSRSRSRDRDRKRSRKSRSKSRDRGRDRDRDRDSKDRRSRDRSRRSKDRDRRSRRRSRSRSPSKEDEEEKKRKEQAAEREANRDEYTVFVACIHPKVDERDLFEFFSHVGRVEDIRLIRDQRTQKSKGLAYIEFWDKECVGKAVTLTGQLLGGYPITITITQSERQQSATDAVEATSMRLYVGDLHENVSDSDLKPVFEAFGEIDFIDLHKDEAGKSKGFGFVQYKSETDARAALEALNGLEIAGKNIKVGIVEGSNAGPATSLDEEGTGGMALNAASRAALMQKLGRGTAMPTFPGAGAPAPSAPAAPSGIMAATNLAVPLIQASTCIIVKNMFDPKTETEADFDLDIKEDVEEEASKFGKLKHIFVDKNSQGFVYMRYVDVDGAKQLVNAFNGRWFASRQISAEYVVDTIYLAKFPEAK